MIRRIKASSWQAALAFGLLALGCKSGGVGDPCVPEDEYDQNFSGFAVTETNVESRSFQCETRVCLVNHFQGRVSCKYGQTDVEANMANCPQSGKTSQQCFVPGDSSLPICTQVSPQLAD